MEKINGKLLTDNNDIFIYIDNALYKVQLKASNMEHPIGGSTNGEHPIGGSTNGEHIIITDNELNNMKDYTGDINKFIVIDNVGKPYITDKKGKSPKEGSITQQISDFINNDTTEASITKLYKRFKDTTNLNCSYTLFYRIYQKIRN